MAFEIYKPRGERAEKAPMVSFSKSSIVLNNVAREKLKAQHVELAYDKDTNLVRIRAVDDGGMQIKKTKVFGKGFFKHFGVNPRGKYEARFDDADQSLYVKINSDGQHS